MTACLARLGAAILVLVGAARAEAAERSWMSDKALVAAAQKEGEVVFFSSYNEDELAARMQMFQEATGIKASFVRGGDEALIAKVTIAARAGKQIWDIVELSNVNGLPDDWKLVFNPSEAAGLLPQAVDPRHRWYATETVFHTPSFNPSRIAKNAVPTSYEDFLHHPELKGHVAMEPTDRWWIAGMFQYYGDEKATALLKGIRDTVDPILYTSHIGLARALGSGEFWIVLNNFLNLTLNVQKAGDPVDYWIVDPVVITSHQVGVNAHGPHPNAGALLANFLISAEGQAQNVKFGRLPVRLDVPTDPPGLFDLIKTHKTVAPQGSAEDDAHWQKKLNELFKSKD